MYICSPVFSPLILERKNGSVIRVQFSTKLAKTSLGGRGVEISKPKASKTTTEPAARACKIGLFFRRGIRSMLRLLSSIDAILLLENYVLLPILLLYNYIGNIYMFPA